VNEPAKRRVLILCTGNSCRSQMAEGWVRHRLGDTWEVHSAGTQPAAYVHPLAIRAMLEAGVDISQHEPKSVQRFLRQPWDLVVTVCDSANESCPSFPGRVGERIHVGFHDPSFTPGSDEERMAAFRRTRDEIRDRLLPEIAARAAKG
jgi:arsenate reductase